MRRQVTIYEVGPRDGLQFESAFFPTADKVALVNLLSASGLPKIEVTSFVHPAWVPQLADSAEVMAAIDKAAGVTYSVLVPNLKGCQGALASRADELTLFVSASESHNRKNVGMSIAESLAGFAEMARLAREAGKALRGYVITAFGCPYEGKVPLENVRRIIDLYAEIGVAEASLGDTTGMANPGQVEDLLAALQEDQAVPSLAVHFHDSRGLGLANAYAALKCGIRVFDSSVAGLGGCPFAAGASGNIATEDLVNMMEELGFATGVDFGRLQRAAALIQTVLAKEPASKTFKAGRPVWRPQEAPPDEREGACNA